MKKIGTYALYGGAFIFIGILIWSIFDSNKKSESENIGVQNIKSNTIEIQEVEPAEKIQVFLFHSTNRCYSCITAGEYTKKMLEQNFSSELKSGKIEFREINVDLPENKEVANKFKASGTSLFTNTIIDGNDNIKEDTQVWRLVSNEQAFSKYLSEKLKKLIGNEVSAQDQTKVQAEDIIFYSGDNCLECASLEKYFQEKDLKNKISFGEKNISKNENDAQQMAEDAMFCNLNEESFAVPFLRVGDKCYTKEADIINFFEQKINGIS